MVVTLRIGRPARRAGGHDRSTRGPGTRRIQRCASNLKGVGTRRTNEYGVFDEVTGQCVGTVGLTRCTTSATSSSQDHSPPSTAGGCPDSTIESDFPGTAQELGETCNATKRRLRQEMTTLISFWDIEAVRERRRGPSGATRKLAAVRRAPVHMIDSNYEYVHGGMRSIEFSFVRRQRSLWCEPFLENVKRLES